MAAAPAEPEVAAVVAARMAVSQAVMGSRTRSLRKNQRCSAAPEAQGGCRTMPRMLVAVEAVMETAANDVVVMVKGKGVDGDE